MGNILDKGNPAFTQVSDDTNGPRVMFFNPKQSRFVVVLSPKRLLLQNIYDPNCAKLIRAIHVHYLINGIEQITSSHVYHGSTKVTWKSTKIIYFLGWNNVN
jgi:hypothetical protein